MFPSRVMRWCTRALKIDTLKRITMTPNPSAMVVNVVGVRAEESRARAGLPEREIAPALNCIVWRPLINWSTQDVIDIHHRHSLPPNPLYYRGDAKRVGCWPCIMSRKSEIRAIAETDPTRIDAIRRLEQIVGDLAEQRKAAKGETLERRPTFFQGDAKNKMPTIDERVEWSKTSRGGRQLTIFREDEGEGCIQWGLCEH